MPSKASPYVIEDFEVRFDDGATPPRVSLAMTIPVSAAAVKPNPCRTSIGQLMMGLKQVSGVPDGVFKIKSDALPGEPLIAFPATSKTMTWPQIMSNVKREVQRLVPTLTPDT